MSDNSLFQNSMHRQSAVDSVVSRFRELIMQKKLRPGDLLPSEGELAAAAGVSRGSVREAMKVLSALGMVDIRRGDGTYVSADFGRTMLDPFLMKLMINDTDTRQLVEFRRMIEFDVVRAILLNRIPDGLAGIKSAIIQMEKAQEANDGMDGGRQADLDMAFHRAMGKATGNVLIEQLYEFVMQFFEPSIRQTYRQPNNAAHALAIHRAIHDALARGDTEAAFDAVQRSIDLWQIQGE